MKNRAVQIISCIALVILTGCQASLTKSSTKYNRQTRLLDFGQGICLDQLNGLMWQMGKSEVFGSWEQAQQYAKNLDLAGFDDWRLPTPNELFIMYRLIDVKYANCNIKFKGSLWAGNTEKNARAGFWDSEPQCAGPSYFFVKSSVGAVIAVRMSKVPP